MAIYIYKYNDSFQKRIADLHTFLSAIEMPATFSIPVQNKVSAIGSLLFGQLRVNIDTFLLLLGRYQVSVSIEVSQVDQIKISLK